MLQRAKFLFGGFIFVSALAVFYKAFPCKKEDFALYQTYKEKSQRDPISKPSLDHSIQKKKGVLRDIWYQKAGERLQYHIQSDHADLIITGKVLEEKMESLSSWFQEKVTPAGQDIRHFWADQGVYHYKDHTFHAERVHLAFFHKEGSSLPLELPPPQELFLKGVAQKATLILDHSKSQFKAQNFSAQITPQG